MSEPIPGQVPGGEIKPVEGAEELMSIEMSSEPVGKTRVEREFDVQYAKEYGEKRYGQFLVEERQRLEQAEARGEKILEIPVTLTVKIPEGELLGGVVKTALDNVVFRRQAEMRPQIVEGINQQSPEMVESAKIWEDRTGEIGRMSFWSNEAQRLIRTESYDLSRAEQIFDELTSLEQKISKSTERSDYLRKLYLTGLYGEGTGVLQKAVGAEKE